MPTDYRDIQEGLTNYVKLGTVIFLSLASLFIIFVVASLERRRKMLIAKRDMQKDFESVLLKTQLEIQEQTLKTISQEIHDNVGQVLSLAKLNLNTLEMESSASKAEKVESSIGLISKAINDLRDLSRSISGDKISDLGLKNAIENELQIINNTGLFKTQLRVVGDDYSLQKQHEVVVFRIVQEILNNALKHSKAKNITGELHYHDQYFSVCISDDGEGFDSSMLLATQTGLGLLNMKSRASLIGAALSIDSSPESGTKIKLEIKK